MDSLLQNILIQNQDFLEENQFLENLGEMQDQLITDYSFSHFVHFDEKRQIKFVKSKDEEIKETQILINKSNKYLQDLISKKDNKDKEYKYECGVILSTAIKEIQTLIYNIIFKNLHDKKTVIDIKEMLLLINEINKMIETLLSTGKIIETEEEQLERSRKLDNLGLKALSLLIQSKPQTSN